MCSRESKTKVTAVFYRGFYRYFGGYDEKGNTRRNESELCL